MQCTQKPLRVRSVETTVCRIFSCLPTEAHRAKVGRSLKLSGTTSPSGAYVLSRLSRRREEGRPQTDTFAGGHRSRVTPVPIPNTEVKPATADGTAWETAWESRSLPALIQNDKRPPSSSDVGRFRFVTTLLAAVAAPIAYLRHNRRPKAPSFVRIPSAANNRRSPRSSSTARLHGRTLPGIGSSNPGRTNSIARGIRSARSWSMRSSVATIVLVGESMWRAPRLVEHPPGAKRFGNHQTGDLCRAMSIVLCGMVARRKRMLQAGNGAEDFRRDGRAQPED